MILKLGLNHVIGGRCQAPASARTHEYTSLYSGIYAPRINPSSENGKIYVRTLG